MSKFIKYEEASDGHVIYLNVRNISEVRHDTADNSIEIVIGDPGGKCGDEVPERERGEGRFGNHRRFRKAVTRPISVCHSNEPWKYIDTFPCIEDANEQIVVPPADGIRSYPEMPPETAERIVACVNFCRSLPTDFLQSHAATGALEASEKYSRLFYERTE